MTPGTTPDPGWYPDPDDASRARYWDGQAWTDRTRALETGAAQPDAPEPAAAKTRAAAAPPTRPARGANDPLWERVTPEFLHGTRGVIIATVSVVVVAAAAIGVWQLTTGNDDNHAATSKDGGRSLDSVLQAHDSGAADSSGNGSFFPPASGSGGSGGSAAAADTGRTASDLGVEDCGNGVAVGPNTTCPFALNVAAKFRAGRARVVTAYSPARNRNYVMTCASGTPTVCRGGDDASVFID